MYPQVKPFTTPDGRLLKNFEDCKINEDIDALTKHNAKFFTVVQIIRGGWRTVGTNFETTQHATFEEAKQVAVSRYEGDPLKRSCLIYAVADYAGALNFSRHLENYPPCITPWTRKEEGKIKKPKRLAAWKIPEGDGGRYLP